jgi:hypothetical protein
VSFVSRQRRAQVILVSMPISHPCHVNLFKRHQMAHRMARPTGRTSTVYLRRDSPFSRPRRRTPGLPPFSSMNSTPAASKAWRTAKSSTLVIGAALTPERDWGSPSLILQRPNNSKAPHTSRFISFVWTFAASEIGHLRLPRYPQ